MSDEKVERLLSDLQLTHLSQYELVQAARHTIYKAAPRATERVMYGGFMFSGAAPFCGVFAYTEHVSVEFGRGCDLDDPHAVLEGTGKLRRHIKLASLSDITAKHLTKYVGAAHKNSAKK
jgi:hypothetical protein